MTFRFCLLILAITAFSLSPSVQAKEGVQLMKVAKSKSVRTISKRSAIAAAKREVNGKVLSAQLIKSRGPAVYRVKMLVGKGRVRTVFVDGIRGHVIRIN